MSILFNACLQCIAPLCSACNARRARPALLPRPTDGCAAFVVRSDKTVIVWHLERSEGSYGVPKRSLTGHSHFVQDVVVSSDGQFALSGSWDGTLRLWDLTTGNTTRRFVGHTKDVLSVAFSVDNRQVRGACAPRRQQHRTACWRSALHGGNLGCTSWQGVV